MLCAHIIYMDRNRNVYTVIIMMYIRRENIFYNEVFVLVLPRASVKETGLTKTIHNNGQIFQTIKMERERERQFTLSF